MNNEHRPYTLIAELTYRCPLHCLYCSNPSDLAEYGTEIDTDTWIRVFQEAEELGVVQLNLTGGEPLLRNDLELLVEKAGRLDLYTNLITSGVPLTFERLTRLRDMGLDSVQISIQSTKRSVSDRLAGMPSFSRKLDAMRWARSLDLPLTLNVVLHRENMAEIEELIELAERVSADRLELANAQYLGWALKNRETLLPAREQIEWARTVAAEAKVRLRGTTEILFVTPDYYTEYPKACMEGWGRRFIVVNPEGLALPCHLAHTIPGLQFEHVTHRRLADIWCHSTGFNRFRGEAWLPDPCRTCEHRTMDFGGCRCQAFHLTGDAHRPDPACSLAPGHHVI
ncbi:MAG: pyrroloquinoline quinone biosynthesis protein PqqE, partial [Nitrospira sp. WS110]|nr:pyrroloquinoline quinone biosynthesis protein PqqE [Nitrospira sp. WS110]